MFALQRTQLLSRTLLTHRLSRRIVTHLTEMRSAPAKPDCCVTAIFALPLHELISMTLTDRRAGTATTAYELVTIWLFAIDVLALAQASEVRFIAHGTHIVVQFVPSISHRLFEVRR